MVGLFERMPWPAVVIVTICALLFRLTIGSSILDWSPKMVLALAIVILFTFLFALALFDERREVAERV